MATIIAGLGAQLGLDTTEFKKGISEAKNSLKELKEYLPEVLSAVGLYEMTKASMEFAEQLAKVAEANDLAIDTVLRLQNALAMSGGEADRAGALLAGFSKNIDLAANGSAKAQKAFAMANVSLKDLATMSSTDLYTKLVQGIASIEDPITRNAKAMELFGKAARGVDFVELNKQIEEGAGVSDQQAKAVTDAAAAWKTLGQIGRDVTLMFAEQTGPVLKQTIDYFKETSEVIIHGFGSVLFVALGNLVDFAANVTFVIHGVYDEIVHTIENAKTLMTEGIDAAIKKNQEYDAMREAAAQKLAAFENNLAKIADEKNNSQDQETEKSKEHETVQRTIIDAYAKQLDTINAQIAATKQQIAIENQKSKLIHDQIFDNDLIIKYATQELDLKQKITAIELKRKEELAKNANTNPEVIAAINQDANLKIALARKVSDDAKLKFKEQYDYQVQLAQQARMATGINEERQSPLELQQMQEMEDAKIASFNKQTQQMLIQNDLTNQRLEYENSIIGLMPREQQYLLEKYDLEAKIVALYKSAPATINKTDLENQINKMRQQDELGIQIKQNTLDQQRTFEYGWKTAFDSYIDNATNAANIAKNMFNSVTSSMDNALANFVKTGKLNFADLARTIIQNIITIQLQAQASSLLGGLLTGGLFQSSNVAVPGEGTMSIKDYFGGPKAAGGDVSGGTPYLVGEQGPELIVPKGSGTVIPNNKLMGMGGSTQNITNNYINAIDTKSFEDRLYGSSGAIWAANQYATKNIATTRSRT
jgi:lambda family phage tail tape measure protein